MARIVCTLALIVLLSVFVGCGDTNRSRLVAPDTRPPTRIIPAGASETDLVEDMTVNRQAYKSGLEQLVAYYTKTGNNMKLRLAQKELTALITMPRYNYIQATDIDYEIAITSFKRAFQWDPDTPHPARFSAARILDQRLHRNAEALQLYQQAVKIEGQFDKYRKWREFAEKRIRELQKLDE